MATIQSNIISLEHIAPDVIDHIFSLVDEKTFCACCIINRKFSEIAKYAIRYHPINYDPTTDYKTSFKFFDMKYVTHLKTTLKDFKELAVFPNLQSDVEFDMDMMDIFSKEELAKYNFATSISHLAKSKTSNPIRTSVRVCKKITLIRGKNITKPQDLDAYEAGFSIIKQNVYSQKYVHFDEFLNVTPCTDLTIYGTVDFNKSDNDDVSEYGQIKHLTIHSIKNKLNENHIRKMPMLETLSLEGTYLDSDFSQKLVNLKQFSSDVTVNTHIRQILSCMPKLEILSLPGTTFVGTELAMNKGLYRLEIKSIRHEFKIPTNLTHLKITSVPGKYIDIDDLDDDVNIDRYIGYDFTNIKYLHAKYTTFIKCKFDEQLEYLVCDDVCDRNTSNMLFPNVKYFHRHELHTENYDITLPNVQVVNYSKKIVIPNPENVKVLRIEYSVEDDSMSDNKEHYVEYEKNEKRKETTNKHHDYIDVKHLKCTLNSMSNLEEIVVTDVVPIELVNVFIADSMTRKKPVRIVHQISHIEYFS